MPSKRAGARAETPEGTRSSREQELSSSRRTGEHEEPAQRATYSMSTASPMAQRTSAATAVAGAPVAESSRSAGTTGLMPLQQVQCFVCGSHLSFQPSSAWILCPGCLTVLNLQPMLDPRAFGGHVICPGCQFMVYFPVECRRVTCAYCSLTIDVAPPQQITCAACRACLLYNAAPSSPIMCLVCQTVMRSDGQIIQSPYTSPQTSAAAAAVTPPTLMTAVATPPQAQIMPPVGPFPYQQMQPAIAPTTASLGLPQTGRIASPGRAMVSTSAEPSGPSGASARPVRRRSGAQHIAATWSGRASSLVPSAALRPAETASAISSPLATVASTEEPSTMAAGMATAAGTPSTSHPMETGVTASTTPVQRPTAAPTTTRTTSTANESASSGTSAESASSPSLARAS
ncbi:hypothetical protein F1559_004260 [Cyanidiococcus yangmingshanensis]|uniref:Zinc finger LSD1-type domain-containing protein n=1 Tax=Cyanidiococcus yangmingshanensis TaxID=2690220 RepID=A0A7J7IHT2_9RHOD|nr:hypothetical protein F1559_004260 [Cyanidiococcus yangmingshanensis]